MAARMRGEDGTNQVVAAGGKKMREVKCKKP
jgi:hypothetical protein